MQFLLAYVNLRVFLAQWSLFRSRSFKFGPRAVQPSPATGGSLRKPAEAARLQLLKKLLAQLGTLGIFPFFILSIHSRSLSCAIVTEGSLCTLLWRYDSCLSTLSCRLFLVDSCVDDSCVDLFMLTSLRRPLPADPVPRVIPSGTVTFAVQSPLPPQLELGRKGEPLGEGPCFSSLGAPPSNQAGGQLQTVISCYLRFVDRLRIFDKREFDNQSRQNGTKQRRPRSQEGFRPSEGAGDRKSTIFPSCLLLDLSKREFPDNLTAASRPREAGRSPHTRGGRGPQHRRGGHRRQVWRELPNLPLCPRGYRDPTGRTPKALRAQKERSGVRCTSTVSLPSSSFQPDTVASPLVAAFPPFIASRTSFIISHSLQHQPYSSPKHYLKHICAKTRHHRRSGQVNVTSQGR